MEVKLFDTEAGMYHFVEKGLMTDLHAHPATEIILAQEGFFAVHTRTAQYQHCKAVLIPVHTPHALHAAEAVCDIILVESILADVQTIVSQLQITDTGEDIINLGDALLPLPLFFDFLQTHSIHTTLQDQRLVDSLYFIHAHCLQAPLRLVDIAQQVHLSPSRFSHWFKAEMGISVREYLAWVRLKFAILTALQNGMDLTDAALSTGFFDSPHFSRKFRAFFGLKPSAVYNSRIVQD
ncbi:MAG: helix-turn-helix transcriptional regulator [Saprospiraceae bacterium]